MITLPDTGIKETVELLLSRRMTQSDGSAPAEIEKAEKRLGLSLPQPLKELYLAAGNNDMLMRSYNEFHSLEELEIIDSKIVFASENQGVCWWGVDPGENPRVYQQSEEGGEWWDEEADIQRFIALLLYFQCAEGGYEYGGTTDIADDRLTELLETEQKLAVSHNGLVIWHKPECLTWYFTDKNNKISGDIYFSALTSEAYKQNAEKYNLKEL